MFQSTTNQPARMLTPTVYSQTIERNLWIGSLCLYGRFHLPRHHLGISGFCNKQVLEILEGWGDNFLWQVLSKPPRKDTFHNELFVIRERLVGNVVVGGSLGHSDHEMAEFKFFSVMTRKDSRVATLDFKTANFELFRELFSTASWESAFEGLGVHKCWPVFKNSKKRHWVLFLAFVFNNWKTLVCPVPWGRELQAWEQSLSISE